MACEYQYQMTDRAVKDLDIVLDYIRNELGNEKAAKTLMADVNKCIERLCAFPESGSMVFDEYLPHVHVRKKVVGNHVLFYRVLKDKKIVRILRIVYGARNMDAVLKNLNN